MSEEIVNSMKTKRFFSYVSIIVGALMASFSVACILIPNDAIDYGTAGIAIIISMLTKANLSLCVFLIFLPFLIAAFIFVGRDFVARTFAGALAYVIGLAYFERIPFELNTEHFLAVIFGGGILGIGLTLVIRAGGCIDGSEILANIIVSKLSDKTGRNYSLTPVLIGFNAIVYILIFILINRDAALLSLLVYFIATVIIDHFTDRFEAIKQVTIITSKPENLVKDIKDELNKTCTIISTKGAISGDNTTLICYVNYFELQKMREIISKNKGSFSTVSTVDEILR